jgi:hypothetical protein
MSGTSAICADALIVIVATPAAASQNVLRMIESPPTLS